MRIVLIVAQSLDGFITKHDESGASWASPADQHWFKDCLKSFDAQVMASSTYETARNMILAKRDAGPRRIIMTRRPDHFAADILPGKLEFSAEPAPAIAQSLQSSGVQQCALLGGAFAHDAFLQAGLVDELWVTIEPRLFGEGTPMVRLRQDQHLTLIDHQRLPNSDSVVMRYRLNP